MSDQTPTGTLGGGNKPPQRKPLIEEFPGNMTGWRQRILVVEDDDLLTHVFDCTLGDQHEIEMVGDAYGALRILGQGEKAYDIIFLDINLGPGSDNGVVLCQRIRHVRSEADVAREKANSTKPPKVPVGASLSQGAFIVAMSSMDDEDTVTDMLAAGANDFIRKPLDARDLQIKTEVAGLAMARLRMLREMVSDR